MNDHPDLMALLRGELSNAEVTRGRRPPRPL